MAVHEKPLFGFPKQEAGNKNKEILETLRRALGSMFAVVVLTRRSGETYYVFQATLEEAAAIAKKVGVKVEPMTVRRKT